jgi:hypothetical protein
VLPFLGVTVGMIPQNDSCDVRPIRLPGDAPALQALDSLENDRLYPVGMRWRSRKTVVVAVLMATMVLDGSAAVADRRAVDDPNDTAARLDLRVVEHGHGPKPADGRRHLRFTIRTYERWRTRVLGDRTSDKYSFEVWISTNGDDSVAERDIVILRARDGSVRARVCCFGEGNYYRSVPSWRPGPRSVTVGVRRALLGRHIGAIHWFAGVEVEYSERNCGGPGGGEGPPPIACRVDKAPNRGTIRHDL